MVLAPHRSVQPDVIFIANERLGIIGECVEGTADLVAEVLSPGTRRRDRLDKRDLYEQHGVKEYWLIDPEARTVEVLFRERGEYHLVGRWQPDGQAASHLLKGFKIPVRELFGSAVSVKGAELTRSPRTGDWKVAQTGSLERLPYTYLALWCDAKGLRQGILQGHDDPVSDALARITPNWNRLRMPAPLDQDKGN